MASKKAKTIVATFGFREKSKRAKLVEALDGGGKVRRGECLKAVYGSANKDNIIPFSMILTGVKNVIKSKRLPFVVVHDKNERKEVTYELKRKRAA